MKHTLPWNVTGIPPEAREVARSAAHREGIAVGEWLTRRILSEGARVENGRAKSTVEAPEDPAPPYRYGREEEVSRERDDLAEKFARSEAETDGAFRRIDDAMRTVARRLELNERTQTEAHRAMSSAAAEINAAARDQAQAFQHLTTRIDSVERQTDTAALRDAVRALHQGLSRLTDQMAKTANESTDQIGTIAADIQELAGRIANAREESQRLGLSAEDRFAGFDERLKETEQRIASSLALEERLNRAEESIASNSASQEILTRLEARLKQIEESIASSSASDGLEARLEARLSFAEERTQEALERHFASMGRNLEDLASRLEKTEGRDDSDTGIQDALRSLGARIEAAEKKNREMLADLEANLDMATKRIETIENAKPLSGPLAPLPPEEAVAGSQLDLPPFPESPLIEAEDHPASGDVEYFSQAASEPTEAFASELPPDHASPENYLAHARRAAQVAAESEVDRGKRAKYRIPFPGEAELAISGAGELKKTRRSSQPYAFAALVLLLVVSGYQITRNVFRESQVVALQLGRPAAPDAPTTTSPAATEKASGASDLAASTIPAETPGEGSVAAIDAPLPAGSPAASASAIASVPAQQTNKAPSSGTPTPVQTAASAAAQQTPASLALDAGASGVSRLISRANSGDAKAALALGLKYANGDGVALNDAEALRWLQKAAEGGEPVAQYRLGTFFEKGRAVDADQDKAMHWYGEAAKNGNRKAMHALGVANANGTSGKKNFPDAVRWFKAAAELGLTDSEFNLAVLYERGLGVQTSLSEAYKWYAIAAAAGDSESKTRVGALATQISATERAAADRVAKDYKPQPMNVAANDGPPLTTN